MNPNDALQLFMALKLHFSTPSYDAIRYQFKIKAKADYTKRKDKYLFEKLSRHPDPKGLLIANLSYKPLMWVGDLFLFDSLERYREWKKCQESLQYIFTETLDKIEKTDFKCLDNQHPILLKKFMRGDIPIDVMSILNYYVGYITNWDDNLLGDPIWEDYSLRLKKYSSFVNFDKLIFKDILKRWL